MTAFCSVAMASSSIDRCNALFSLFCYVYRRDADSRISDDCRWSCFNCHYHLCTHHRQQVLQVRSSGVFKALSTLADLTGGALGFPKCNNIEVKPR